MPLGNNIDESLTVDAQRHRTPQVEVIERRLVAVDEYMAVDATGRRQLAHRVWHLALDILQERHRELVRKGHVELSGDEGQRRGSRITDDRILDTVEIGPIRLPVIGV